MMRLMGRDFRVLLAGLWSAAFLSAVLMTASAYAAEPPIDPEATRILKSMSAYMGKTQAFSVNADIALEVVKTDGQKVQLTSSAKVKMDRPSRFSIEREGMFAHANFVYDGKAIAIYGKRQNVYTELKAPGTTDDAILAYEKKSGIPVPGADLLFSDSYNVLSRNIVEGAYIGTTYVNGVECHQLTFRNKGVDWQLWVKTGDKPLPIKYVITSKLQAAAPEYEITLSDWNTNPTFEKKTFELKPPPGAKQLPFSQVVSQVEKFVSSAERCK